MRRFGAPAVTLGFLTVGVQTAINASAGMLRMPQRRFLPAVTVGAALWSLLYTTVGFTVVDAWLGNVSLVVGGRRGGVVVAIVVLSGRLERRRRPMTRPVSPTPVARPPTTPPPRPDRPDAAGDGLTSWALASTCWHAPIMETRPSGVPEAPDHPSVRGPPTRAPASGRPADDRPQHRKRDLS